MAQVGVVLPTRDRPDRIGRAVRSVLDQSFRDIEVVVVDDGSTVPAEQTLDGQDDPRLRVLRSSVSVGPARARNLGLRALSSPWVAFQDDDDEWLPGKLAAQVDLAHRVDAHVAVIYGYFTRIGRDGRERPGGRRVDPPRGDLLAELLLGNFIALPAVLVRSRALEELGAFDPLLPCLEDWELFLRLAERFEFDCVEDGLVRTHESATGVNRAPSATQAEALERILVKHRRRIEADPRVHAWFLLHIGHQLCLAGQLDRGRGFHRNALRVSPSVRAAATVAATWLGPGGYRSLARLYGGMRAKR